MSQFDEGKEYKGIRAIKTFQSENTKSAKGKQYVRNTNLHLTTKVTPAIDFTNEPIIWCDILVVGNNFVDNCK